jgi:hypothetical protein
MGHVFMALGIGAVVTGVVLASLGERAAKRAGESPTLEDFDANVSEAQRYRVGAVATVIGGGVLISVGIVRFAMYGDETQAINHGLRLSLDF